MLCFKADMRKIMLTVFKHNPEAQKFFRTVMKFETDETNPYDDVYEQVISIVWIWRVSTNCGYVKQRAFPSQIWALLL